MQCLIVKPMTIKQQLFLMIAKHGLHEVLDRIEELVAGQVELADSDALDQVLGHLERARAESLNAVDHEWR